MEMISSIRIDSSSGSALIEAMADYVSAGVAGPLTREAEALVGAAQLRHVCITLLSWLKGRVRFSHRKVMGTDEAGSAKAALVKLVQCDRSFSSVFVVEGDKLRLYCESTSQQVDEIVVLADRLYNPPRFVTRRPTEQNNSE